MNRVLTTLKNRFDPGTARQILAVAVLAMMPVLMPMAMAGGRDDMMREYDRFQQSRSEEGLPFSLSSQEKGPVSIASVSAYLPGISMEMMVDRLSRASEWCELVPIHLNIKACAYVGEGMDTELRFYMGVKTYLTPDRASMLGLSFLPQYEDGVFSVSMTSENGPYGSSDYRFHLRAIDVEAGIFLQFDMSNVPGLAAGLASIYLMTVARNKIGFTVEGKTWTGKPKYVGGQRGAAERNIVRYLLAIKTYFDTLDVDVSRRFEERIDRWFTETEKYSRQLWEMDRATYLSTKHRERKNQEILMAALESGTRPVYEVEKQKNP